MPTSPCPANCGNTRAPRQYLCRTCWFQLPTSTRRALSNHGPRAMERLRELLDRIHDGTPLPEIRIE